MRQTIITVRQRIPFCLPQYGTNTSMCILCIIYRIVITLFLRKSHIKIKVRIQCTLYEIITGSIYTYFIAKFTNGNRIPGTLAHFYFHTVFYETNHLDDIHFQIILLFSKRLHRRLQTRYITVMIRTPEVHQLIIPAFKFGNMICNIRYQICIGTVTFFQNAVFTVPISTRTKPYSSIFFICLTQFHELLQHRFHLSFIMQ